MHTTVKFATLAATALVTAAAVGVFGARGEPPGDGGAPENTRVRVTIAHALGLGITGTTTQLAARGLASAPGPKGGEDGGPIEALREQARKSYESSRALFEKARAELAKMPGDEPTVELYDAAIAFVGTLWDLAGEAAPVAEPKAKSGATGELNPADVAALQVIAGTVHQASGSYLLAQLAHRLGPPDAEDVKTLIQSAGKGASAAKKNSAKFPGVAEKTLADLRGKVAHEKEVVEVSQDRLKLLEKAEKVADAGTQSAEKREAEAIKTAKKAAAKAKAADEAALDKAKAAVKAGVGRDVGSKTVQTLAERGRLVVLLFEHLAETPEEVVHRKAEAEGKVLTGKEFGKEIEKARKKVEAEDREIKKRLDATKKPG